MVTASTTSDATYSSAVNTGESPASRALSTPSGMPAPICETKIRNTPSQPAGQKLGSGAVGSHMARVSSFSARIRSSLDMQQAIIRVGSEYGRLGSQTTTMQLARADPEQRFARQNAPAVGLDVRLQPVAPARLV